MSARKALARMESPAIDTAEGTLQAKEGDTVEKSEPKTMTIENGEKTHTPTTQTVVKPDIQIKQETPDQPGEKSTQSDSLVISTVTSITETKRLTRNSPMMMSSPSKKKLSDSQEQDSSAESTSTTDDGPKKTDKPVTAGRPRKPSDSKSSSSAVPPTNRLTRKAAAQDWAANTRLTRARRGSVGPVTRPDTSQKRKYLAKKNPTDAVKRKRSVSPKSSADEPEPKVSKLDDQGEDFGAITIKQEILESSEEMASDVASDITEPFPATEPTSRISLRARKSAMCYSPTTRPYRRDKDKMNTDSGTPDSKRKRGARVRPDEDSKDSLASSTLDDVDVKVEDKSDDASEATTEQIVAKSIEGENASDFVTNTIVETTPEANLTEPADKPLTEDKAKCVDAQLTVDTTLITTVPETPGPSTSTAAVSEQSNTSEKAASLSPDMVSEGVSEISVKEFYKEPEFLENNLGIEKDPKLGEIVQNVSEKMDETVDEASVSNESMKEGALVFEEEDEEVASIGSIKHENDDDPDDDANSVSTGFISPLIVEEDEEEDQEAVNTTLNGGEKVEEVSTADEVTLSEEQVNKDLPSGDLEKEKDVKESVAEEHLSSLSAEMEVESKDEQASEKEKVEPCDKEVASDIEEKDTLKTEGKEALETEKEKKETNDEMLDTEAEKKERSDDAAETEKAEKEITNIKEDNKTTNDTEENKPKEEDNIVSKDNKKEEAVCHKEDTIEKMEVDVPKIEETKFEETNGEEITDHEENKENVEVGVDCLKEEAEDMTKLPDTDNVALMSADEREETASESSKVVSPSKSQEESSEESTTPSTSPESSKSSSVSRTPENDEKLRLKERHLKTLGLLTHKAADEAIMAKQKRRKFLHNLSNNSGSKKTANSNSAANAAANSNAGSAAGNGQNKSSQEYTGTLKTVIKLNRQTGGNGNGNGNGTSSVPANDSKKGKQTEGGSKAATSGYTNRRQSLKMTFQKGRGRPANVEKTGEHPANTSGEDSYYTIQNEGEGATATVATVEVGPTENKTPATTTTTTHGRKSYNRSNTADPTQSHTEHHEATPTTKKDEKDKILIPEKASSFKFHPGRLCQDQCYYCSGKFGLYDTPCHVGQIKSVERQQKILANEEKLTVDNCLCDACFRHVDRRANVPSYKKRLSAPGHIETASSNTSPDDAANDQDKPQEPKSLHQQSHMNGTATFSGQTCAVPNCGQKAAHSLRRKALRKSIKKSLFNFDMSAAGTYLHICEKHYEAVVHSTECVLCKRRLGKSNMFHITTDTDRLEKALSAMGIPVSLGQGNAVCKLCRYFANLLIKPPEHGKQSKIAFVKNYRKRLLQFYNIHDKKDTSHEDDDEDMVKEKPVSKKKDLASTTKRKSRAPDLSVSGAKETMRSPPSPAHSTGSSVEVISDVEECDVETAKKPAAVATSKAKSPSNQMVLDNDVLVGYDVPMISDSSSSASPKSTSPSPQRIKPSREQQSKLKAILQSVGTSLEDRNDISTALRSNPNISMRELFPGEEDLGLQFKAPFGGKSAQRTPEGWTRINTFLQYDEPTRRLWEDLQKPYGNQSSFLRHLILLEKYYRNGDLILSSSASSNATVYTQTVRNRLTSFDSHGSASSSPTKELERRSRSLSVDKIQRQLSSNSVTITARPKDTKSLPKEDDKNIPKDGAPTAAPPTTATGAAGSHATSTPNSRSILKTNLITSKSGAVEIVSVSAPNSKSNSPHSSGGASNNDTTLLTKQQKILAAANKLMSNKLEASPQKKSSLNTTPPELISLNRRPVPAQPVKRPQLLPKPMKPIPPNVIVLPDTLTAQERLESKSWRPTLLPVTTTSHHLNNQQGPLYQTADGRRLPALVQVQSGGRPFLISIHDYNRMCILRREKLMRDQMLKGSKGKLKGPIFPAATTGAPLPATIGKASSALQSYSKAMQAEIAAKKQRFIMSKPSNLAPIAPKPSQTSTSTATTSSTSTSQSQPAVILPASALQPINLLSTQTSSLSILPNFAGQVMPILNSNTGTSSSAIASGTPTNSWLWNNFPDPNQMLMNGKPSTAPKGAPATITSAKQQSLLLDNSLMSKIPKSLTVIPQHKLMPASSSAGNISKD